MKITIDGVTNHRTERTNVYPNDVRRGELCSPATPELPILYDYKDLDVLCRTPVSLSLIEHEFQSVLPVIVELPVAYYSFHELGQSTREPSKNAKDSGSREAERCLRSIL